MNVNLVYKAKYNTIIEIHPLSPVIFLVLLFSFSKNIHFFVCPHFYPVVDRECNQQNMEYGICEKNNKVSTNIRSLTIISKCNVLSSKNIDVKPFNLNSGSNINVESIKFKFWVETTKASLS